MTHYTRRPNQRSDSHIATPISEEGLPGYEGSGSVLVYWMKQGFPLGLLTACLVAILYRYLYLSSLSPIRRLILWLNNSVSACL